MKKVLIVIIARQSFPFFFVACLLTGCTGRDSSKKNNPVQQKTVPPTPVQYKKPPASFNDTLVINNMSAVFYSPDSLQLAKIKAISKKEIYETEVHNCVFLMRNARIILKKYWPKIHIIDTKTNRFLLFQKADKRKTCIDLNNQGDMCGILLFDGKKEPELADMMNMETALGFYFDK
ncbi:MAG: hypothetical protein E6H09_14110 [Bacteroidetes bacterium]|nr:MAG: hypothetical protein E6H09_14110 [Bacteroidota bacterium]